MQLIGSYTKSPDWTCIGLMLFQGIESEFVNQVFNMAEYFN
jgi:hypothetical protein